MIRVKKLLPNNIVRKMVEESPHLEEILLRHLEEARGVVHLDDIEHTAIASHLLVSLTLANSANIQTYDS